MTYDKYYETENLFGEPYPELIEFFEKYPSRGNLLDLGCGQGRDAIPLAQMGFTITGIDNSKLGIEQMNQIAKTENLPLTGIVDDIYKFEDFMNFDFILLDSMFHFNKKDRKKETEFIKKIISNSKKGCLLVFCIQDTDKKVQILNETLDEGGSLTHIANKRFKYLFEDKESGHNSTTDYRMIVVMK